MNKISAVIICKNESSCIETMLKSIKWVDNIYITDTGSSDNTVEIAKQYTDNITLFPWIDDFQAARNYAKQFTTNDLILSCDCDEVMEEWWIEKLKSLEIPEWVDGVYITMWNWAEARFDAIRMFRKELNWHWKIHECIIPSKTITSWVTIKYWRSLAHLKDPHLDMRILEKVYNEDKTNSRSVYYFAREKYYYKQWEDAERLLLEYLALNSPHAKEVTDAYYLLAMCYWYDGKWNWQKARDACMQAIYRNPNFSSALKLMAEMHYEPNKNRWETFALLADNTGLLFIH